MPPEPLTRGLPPPDPRSLCPLSSTEFVEPPPTNKIPRYATGWEKQIFLLTYFSRLLPTLMLCHHHCLPSPFRSSLLLYWLAHIPLLFSLFCTLVIRQRRLSFDPDDAGTHFLRNAGVRLHVVTVSTTNLSQPAAWLETHLTAISNPVIIDARSRAKSFGIC